jgi:Flp pilus assembly protein TadG
MFQTAVGLMALLALVGFTIDGGILLARYQRDKTALDIAAQVASHAVDWPYFESTQQVRLDYAQAYNLAQYYASLNSRNTIRNITVYTWPPNAPTQVIVAGTARIPTGFWRVIGVNEVNIRMTSIARPAHGISRERQ